MADETMAEEIIRWFAGIDWGSAKHQACLLDGAGRVVGERAFAHGGAGLAALCDWPGANGGAPNLVAGGLRVPPRPGGGGLLGPGVFGYAAHSQLPGRVA